MITELFAWLQRQWERIRPVADAKHPEQSTNAMSPLLLRPEKLPKLVRDGKTGRIVHEFVFSVAEDEIARSLRNSPHPKLKRNAHDEVTVQDSWGGSSW